MEKGGEVERDYGGEGGSKHWGGERLGCEEGKVVC